MARTILDRVVKQTVKALSAATDPLLPAYGGPRLLVYHQVDAGLGREMEVTFAAFLEQLAWLEEHYEIVSFEEAWQRRAEAGAERLVVLTFDDGYDDMYRLAYPLLEERSLPFILYLTTHPTESGEALFPGGEAEPCSWDQVEEMAGSGLMTLGAHTHRHDDLRTLSPEQVASDIGISNEIIRRRMGMVPRHFCYPYGFWSETAHRPVAATYDTAVLGSGRPLAGDTDPLMIPRVPVQLSDGLVWFKRKLAGGFRLEDRLRRRFKGYRGP